MKLLKPYHKIVYIFLLALLVACNPARHLSDEQYLLIKNKIEISNRSIESDDISAFIKQKPNRKFLGFYRFHLGAYNLANRGKKETKIKKWLKNTVGEPPVILDTILTNNSVNQIGFHLNNKGFFNSEVTKSIKIKKKKAKVTYNIIAAQPYKIRNIEYSIADKKVLNFVHEKQDNSLLIKGNNYDVDILDDERERITKNLKDLGYFYFVKEYIRFKIDSSLNSHQLDILITISNFSYRTKENPDSIIRTNHKRYKINNIYIFSDYHPIKSDTIKYDTLQYGKNEKNKYYFLNSGKPKYKPKTISRMIFIKRKEYYNLENVNMTYKRLSELNNFKYIDIHFTDLSKDSLNNPQKENLLNCIIKLTRLEKQSYTIETEGTNSSGDLGIAANLVYQNNNLLKGSEIFLLKAKSALEMQKVVGDNTQSQVLESSILPFNTIEAGFDALIIFPKFLVPIKQERFPKYFKPKSTISTGYNYQKRPDYTRYITNITFGYDWKESEYKRHILNLVEINSVKIYPDSSFLKKISSFDKKIQNSYSDHLVMGLKYSWIYNNQKINKLQDFTYFKINGEFVGNLVYLTNLMLNSAKDENGNYTLFNIRYAQYFRGDFDYRHYFYFSHKDILAFRYDFGIGIPYKNMNVLPFEKSFYVGGANGIRAWRIRDIGPGGYYNSNTADFDKTGDIGLETSLEYRFPIYKIFEGAAFVDAGNVWYLNKNSQFPDAEFKFNRFYKEIAVGWGLGLRFNFSFFIIRTDFGLPVHDPSKPQGDRWVITNSKLNINFAIGYPF